MRPEESRRLDPQEEPFMDGPEWGHLLDRPPEPTRRPLIAKRLAEPAAREVPVGVGSPDWVGAEYWIS